MFRQYFSLMIRKMLPRSKISWSWFNTAVPTCSHERQKLNEIKLSKLASAVFIPKGKTFGKAGRCV